jgi:hypothetical protein
MAPVQKMFEPQNYRLVEIVGKHNLFQPVLHLRNVDI